ncbi:MAG: hypothetical protein AAB801_01745 [Patescibacteria group bacterium]
MLSKNDLQQIRKIVREETEEENENTRRELRTELKLFRMQLEDRMGKIENSLKNLSIRLRKIEKDISTAIDIFDRTDVSLTKRVEKIEEHLQI